MEKSFLESFFISVFMVFFVAIPEEFLYRGLLYKYLTIFFPAIHFLVPLLVSTIIFGLAHLRMGKKMMLLATIAGFGYGLVYALTQNIYMAIILHLAANIYWQCCFIPDEEQ